MTALAALAAGLIACTAPTVHDGDTLRCGSDRIRLFGVDAPEVKRSTTTAEPLAYEARDLLITLTRGRGAASAAAFSTMTATAAASPTAGRTPRPTSTPP
ncbi:thermonuclease family protein [Caulobacter sp. DWR3-1-2]|uniref:thermonuclease family protein n=1 Tax=Caulobacter sp. DWR3-1-2 TaxID=2804647 RepID=UPI003CEE5665